MVSGFVGIRTSRAQITDTQQTTTAAKEGTTATAATSAAPAYTIGEVSPNVVNKNKEYSFYAKTDILPSLTKGLKCAFIPNEDDPKNMITATLGPDDELTALYAYPNTGNPKAFFACKYFNYNVSKELIKTLGLKTSIIVKSFIGELIDIIIDAITTPPTPPSPEPPPPPPPPKSLFSGNCLTKYQELLECDSPRITPITSFLWFLSCCRGTANSPSCGKK